MRQGYQNFMLLLPIIIIHHNGKVFIMMAHLSCIELLQGYSLWFVLQPILTQEF